MMNSSAYTYQQIVEEVAKIKSVFDDLKEASNYANAIAEIIKGANSSLSSDWEETGSHLKIFSGELSTRLEDLFKYIYDQMQARMEMEEQMGDEIIKHREVTSKIMSDLESALGKGLQAGAAAAGAGMAGNVGRAVEAGIAGAGATGRVGDAVSSAITAAGAAAANAGENN